MLLSMSETAPNDPEEAPGFWCSWVTTLGQCSRPGRPVHPDIRILLCSQHGGMLLDWAYRQTSEVAAKNLKRAERLLREEVAEVQVLRLEHKHLVTQAMPAAAGPSVVYVVQRDDGLIKIGTTVQYRTRMGALRSAYGELTVLAVMPGGYPEEAQLHRTFAAHLAEGREWFHPAPVLLDWVASLDTEVLT